MDDIFSMFGDILAATADSEADSEDLAVTEVRSSVAIAAPTCE